MECVLHPRLWNTTEIWDPLGVGQMYHDEYEEENIGYQIGTVSESVLALSLEKGHAQRDYKCAVMS